MKGMKLAALTSLAITAMFVMAAAVSEPADSQPGVSDSWYSASDGLFIVEFETGLEGYYTCTVTDAEGVAVHADSNVNLPGVTMLALNIDEGKSVSAGDYTVSIIGVAASYSLTVTAYEVTVDTHTIAKLNGSGDDISDTSVILGSKDYLTVSFPEGYELDATDGMTVTDSKYYVDSTEDAHSITSKASEYEITFVLGDGSWKEGFTAPEKYTYGAVLTLPIASDVSVYQKTGYSVTFDGWYLTDDANKTIVTQIAADATGEKSFTAKYTETPNQYTVNFDKNNGTGEMSDQAFVCDVEQALTENAFTRTGYAFSGWNTAADGKGTPYADKESVSNLVESGNVTLYAQWTPNGYTVVFDKNNGTGEMSDQEFTYDAEQALTENAFTRTGYAFAGWNTAADGSGTSYADKVPVTNLATTGSVTLYAQWTANTYKVSFKANEGTGTTADQEFTYDEAQNLTANTFARTGYTFTGWNTVADGSGTPYADKASVSNLATTGTVELFAQWSINSYQLKIVYTGYSEVIPDYVADVEYNSQYSVASPVKEGYTADVLTVSGTMPAEDVTVTVTYTIDKFTVTIVSNDDGFGTVSKSSVTQVPWGSAVTVDGAKITVIGTDVTATPGDTTAQYEYAFDSWSVANGYLVKDDVTITATFTQTVRTYDITIAVQGNGTVSAAKIEAVPYGKAFTVNENAFAVNGTTITATPNAADAEFTHTFKEWLNVPETVTGLVTVTAVFETETNRYEVTLTPGENTAITDVTGVENGKVAYNGSFTFKASTDTGYDQNLVVKSNGAAIQPDAQGVYSVTVTAAVAITTETTVNMYAVNFVQGDNTMITDKTGLADGKIAHGGNLTFKVTTTEGYDQSLVVKNGNDVLALDNGVYSVTGVTGAITISTETSINLYTVSFASNNNGFGTVSETSVTQVPWGSSMTIDGSKITVIETDVTATPSETTAQYEYAFDSWSVANGYLVKDDVTITATFTQTVRTYDITIAVQGNGTVSAAKIEAVPYGKAFTVSDNTFTVNGTTITATPKTADAQYTYVFKEWLGVPESVTGAASITAVFEDQVNRYEVTFSAGAHTSITDVTGVENGKVAYNGSFSFKVTADAGYDQSLVVKSNGTAIQPDAQGVYSVTVTAAVAITTETTVNMYAVSFVQGDNTTITDKTG